jgi:DNA-binding response OmpR family regulator
VYRGCVLVIHGREPAARSLARSLEQTGYKVSLFTTARAGFDMACKMTPDCIVCTVDLPDIDGFWVCRRIRTEASEVAKTPLLVLSDASDRTLRIQGLRVGGDTVLDSVATNEEIVAQVTALIGSRERWQLDSAGEEPTLTSTPASSSAAFRGDLANFPLTSILMMLEMERRTGTLEIIATSGKRGVLTLTAGLFVTTEMDGKPAPPLGVLREVLSWRTGRFVFFMQNHAVVSEVMSGRPSIGALVLDAMRLEDEEKNAT